MSRPALADRWHWLRSEYFLLTTVVMLCSATTMALGYNGKTYCAGPPFNPSGRSLNLVNSNSAWYMPCYSDIQKLYSARDLVSFPYLNGGITPRGALYGGTVEYPVLSGVLMHLGAIGTWNDSQYLLRMSLILVPFALLISLLLTYLVRRWALLWAATPPLMLYAFHNWELPVVAAALAAVALMLFGEMRVRAPDGTLRRRLPLRLSATGASVLLAIGFCLKIYPGFFVIPLAIYVFTRGLPGRAVRRHPLSVVLKRGDWLGATYVTVAAAVTVVAINLPFMLMGYRGWRASLTFQEQRRADSSTNSIWYWGPRKLFTGGSHNADYNALINVLSPLAVVVAFAIAIGIGTRIWLSGKAFPWIGVSAAMLAAFIVFHKVHSPQYTLWILPFLILLKVDWRVIVSFLALDWLLDLAVFPYLDGLSSRWPTDPMYAWLVQVAVWGQSLMLIAAIVLLPYAQLRYSRPAFARTPAPTEPGIIPEPVRA